MGTAIEGRTSTCDEISYDAAIRRMRQTGYPDESHLENLVHTPSRGEAAAFFESQAQDANFENDW